MTAIGPHVIMPPFDDRNNAIRATYNVINAHILTSKELPVYIPRQDIFVEKSYWNNFMKHDYLAQKWKRAEWFTGNSGHYQNEYIILDI